MTATQLDLFTGPSDEATSWRHPRANRQCRLGELWVAYEFQRGQRRTIGLSVGPQGLSVRAPRWAPESAVEAFLHEKAGWIRKQWQALRERQRQAPPAMAWVPGAEVLFLGQPLRLELDPSHAFEGAGASRQDHRLVIALAHDAEAQRVREVAQAWLRRQALAWFTERLDHFSARMGLRYRRLGLSSASTRWGSASVDGSIRLNWRLIHLPVELIDYVVVHELSHLRQMNHGPAFWAEVARVLPDHVARRQALRAQPPLPDEGRIR
jgi:predicted metal-dependent hydrolase